MALESVLSAVSPLWALTNTVARAVALPRARRLPVPVISIGNIVAGGVGKTEVAAAIAARLVSRGARVVVASRGYGSDWERRGGVARDTAAALSMKFPDEAIVILKKAPGAMVAVGADRAAVLEKHWEELGPDVVLLDDGYQHFALARSLDVLVHDFTQRWPILRDLPVALKRASTRIALSDVPASWKPASGESPWVRARYFLANAEDAVGRARRLPPRALAFCGIGNPIRFKRALEEAGVKVESFKAFEDHAVYSLERAKSLTAWQRSHGSLPLLTTLKDYVKLGAMIESQGGVAGFEPLCANVRLEFVENEEFLWKAIDECVSFGVA